MRPFPRSIRANLWKNVQLRPYNNPRGRCTPPYPDPVWRNGRGPQPHWLYSDWVCIYVARYGAAFPYPARVRAYNPSIDDDATAVVRARTEVAHKRSAQTARHTRQRGERRHNSYLPSSLIHGSASSRIQRQSTLKFHKRTSTLTSKRGARAGTRPVDKGIGRKY